MQIVKNGVGIKLKTALLDVEVETGRSFHSSIIIIIICLVVSIVLAFIIMILCG